MNLSIFDNDQMFGDVSYELAHFAGSLRAYGIWGNDTAVSEVQAAIIQQGWGVTSFSMTPAGFASNFWNIDFTINAICGDDKDRIVDAITSLLEGLGFYEVNISFRSSSGCAATPVPQATRPRVVPMPFRSPTLSTNNRLGVPAYNAGELATVTVHATPLASDRTLLYLAGGLLALLVLKQ